MTRVRALALDELWIGEARGLRLAGVDVLLYRDEQGVHAYHDRCSHRGVALSRGKFEGSVVTCCAHEWSFDLATGAGVNPASARLSPLAVTVQLEQVLVEVPDESRETPPEKREVGPVLMRGVVADAIVAAIRGVNGDARVLDRGAYLRVAVPERCELTRRAVELHLGRAFELPSDLELVMPSFAGRLSIDGERAVWSASSLGGAV